MHGRRAVGGSHWTWQACTSRQELRVIELISVDNGNIVPLAWACAEHLPHDREVPNAVQLFFPSVGPGRKRKRIDRQY